MNKIVVRGGKPLNGTIRINGMKNAALPIVFATVVTGSECIIENIPPVNDVLLALEILRDMGAEVEFEDIFQKTVRINTANIKPCSSSDNMVSRIRGSIYLAGAELARFGKTSIALPGGCNFGERPIDQHEMAFRELGAEVITEDMHLRCHADNGLTGTTICFNKVSVGATVNAILAASTAKGITIIENAAKEPHIVDLANFLNTCGAEIYGAGAGTIKVHGVEKLHGCSEYTIIPDMIEAGTYMAAVAATGGCVRIENVIPKHLESIAKKLVSMGVVVKCDDDAVTVTAGRRLRPISIDTQPYPGFPTDMHPQFSALLCTVEGKSQVFENIFSTRFRYVEELSKMGADIVTIGNSATINGGKQLHGASVKAVDLRAGAAMIIAGLCADGETEINDVESIQRGYYSIVRNFQSLGADIEEIQFARHIYMEE